MSSTQKAHGFGRVGIWSMEFRFGDPELAAQAAAEVEDLGYGAIWIPGAIGGDVLGDIERLAGRTQRIKFAAAILNIYRHDADYVVNWWNTATQALRSRVLLGIGVSHAPLIGEAYRKPLAAMRDYLDALDAAGIPAASRCLAALGPKMLELAAQRSAGAHPYLVSLEHTKEARAVLGPDVFLAPELGVVVETDPVKARELARQALSIYLKLPNYTNNFRRLGFSEEEISTAGDRLIDHIFAWGAPEQIAARVKAFHDAGADHVCLQVCHPGSASMTPPVEQYRALAKVLL